MRNQSSPSGSQAVQAPAGTAFAGLLPRAAALGLDYLLFMAVFFPVTRLVKGVWLMSPADHRWVNGWIVSDPICLVFLAVIFAYFIFLEGWTGRTVGKLLMRLRVVDAGGNRPGLRRALLRNAGRMIDGLPAFNILGIWLIASTPERTRFGDRIAGTRVVRG